MDTFSRQQAKTASRSTGDSDHESASMEEEREAAPVQDSDWRTDSVTLRKAENGGVIVTCSKSRDRKGPDDYDTYKSKDYAYSNVDEALQFAGTELEGAKAGSGNGNPVSAVPGRY